MRSKAKPTGKAAKTGAVDDAEPKTSNVVNLMEALRRSIHAEKAAPAAGRVASKAKPASVPPKAGGRKASAKRAAATLKKAN